MTQARKKSETPGSLLDQSSFLVAKCTANPMEGWDIYKRHHTQSSISGIFLCIYRSKTKLIFST